MISNQKKIISIFFKAYLKDILQKRKEAFLCLVSTISLVIAIIVLSIGFSLFIATQEIVLTTIKGIQPDLTLYVPYNQENIDEIQQKLTNLGLASSKTRWDYGAIVYQDEIAGILLIKTINSTDEQKVCSIKNNLELLEHPMSAIVGKTLFDEQVVDNKIEICVPDKNDLRPTTLDVVGVVQTGFEEIDQSLVIISEHTSDWLFGKEADTLQIKTKDNTTQTIQTIYNETGLIAQSWQDLYPALSMGLNIQSYATNIIAFLISLLSLSSTLLAFYALISEKKRNINILLKQGLKKNLILTIDFLILLLIILIAATLSVILNLIIIKVATTLVTKYATFQPVISYRFAFVIPILFSFLAALSAFGITYFNVTNCSKYKK